MTFTASLWLSVSYKTNVLQSACWSFRLYSEKEEKAFSLCKKVEFSRTGERTNSTVSPTKGFQTKMTLKIFFFSPERKIRHLILFGFQTNDV